MSIHQLLRSKRRKILQIAARHGARRVRVFGSVARGTARRGSDIDFLVEMEEGRSLLDHATLILDLERLLKRPVDVASERGLRQPLRKEVLRDAIALRGMIADASAFSLPRWIPTSIHIVIQLDDFQVRVTLDSIPDNTKREIGQGSRENEPISSGLSGPCHPADVPAGDQRGGSQTGDRNG